MYKVTHFVTVFTSFILDKKYHIESRKNCSLKIDVLEVSFYCFFYCSPRLPI